jgi:5-(aminomethyl)-3-furanmethanol phosphate kinase
MTVQSHAPVVVKVGGSLFDLPHFGAHLRSWLRYLPTRRVLLVAGGGPAANWVRAVDRLDNLGEEPSHWLALRAMSFTAAVLAARLGQADLIEDIEDRHKAWERGRWPVLDMYRFARDDEMRPGPLPHCWATTSDALAARAALVAGISTLILLKSVALPDNCDWTEAARQGVVDAVFPRVIAAAGNRLRASVVNFRQYSAPASSAATQQSNTL